MLCRVHSLVVRHEVVADTIILSGCFCSSIHQTTYSICSLMLYTALCLATYHAGPPLCIFVCCSLLDEYVAAVPVTAEAQDIWPWHSHCNVKSIKWLVQKAFFSLSSNYAVEVLWKFTMLSPKSQSWRKPSTWNISASSGDYSRVPVSGWSPWSPGASIGCGAVSLFRISETTTLSRLYVTGFSSVRIGFFCYAMRKQKLSKMEYGTTGKGIVSLVSGDGRQEKRLSVSPPEVVIPSYSQPTALIAHAIYLLTLHRKAFACAGWFADWENDQSASSPGLLIIQSGSILPLQWMNGWETEAAILVIHYRSTWKAFNTTATPETEVFRVPVLIVRPIGGDALPAHARKLKVVLLEYCVWPTGQRVSGSETFVSTGSAREFSSPC